MKGHLEDGLHLVALLKAREGLLAPAAGGVRGSVRSTTNRKPPLPSKEGDGRGGDSSPRSRT